MKQLLIFLILSLGSAAALAEQYGAEVSAGEPISISEAIASLDAGRSETLLVEGEVTSVCQVKGCWLGFSSEAGDVRVTFKDYGFFVPMSIRGKTARVEGTLEKVELSLAESRHLIEDAGGDPSIVTEPIVEYQFVASGVEVRS